MADFADGFTAGYHDGFADGVANAKEEIRKRAIDVPVWPDRHGERLIAALEARAHPDPTAQMPRAQPSG